MTAPGRHPAWHRVVLGSSIIAGLALLSLAMVLGVDRSPPANATRAVPTVNRGAVPVTTPAAGRVASPPQHADTTLPRHSRLRLDRLGLDAPISPVAAVGNVMQIPRNPHQVGWWTAGATPGSAGGSAVIVGHINYAGVAGALSVLPAARPGDALTVDEPHHRLRYRVVALRSYPKSSGIPASAFSRRGPARLVLITCGGPFDPATGNYRDNIVAYAQPA